MLSNKVIVVTGGGSGIGKAACNIMADAGASIISADINFDNARAVAADLEKRGRDCVPYEVDLAKPDMVAALFSFIEQKFGRLDGAFNNAGVGGSHKQPDELGISEWQRVIDVNLSSVFYCMRHEIALMRKTGGGAIVNTSSVCGVVGIPCAIEYVAAKHGVIGATRAGAVDTATTGVRVNAVLPGMTRTPMVEGALNAPEFEANYQTFVARHSVGRIGEPEDIAYAVKWLLSDEARFVNGAVIPIDGGYTAA